MPPQGQVDPDKRLIAWHQACNIVIQQDDPSEQGGFGMNLSKLLTATTLAFGFLLTSCTSTQSNSGHTRQNSDAQQRSFKQEQTQQNSEEQAKSSFDSKFHRNGGA